MTILATRAALIAAALGLAPLPAAAATATPLGQFGSWTAAAFGEGEARSCYILATPASAEPASLRHGEVYFFVKEAETPQATESSLQAGGMLAAGAMLTRDLYKRYLNPTASHTTQKLFGRLGVLVIVLAALVVATT